MFAPLHPKGVIERTLPASALVGLLDPASVHEFASSTADAGGGRAADERRVAEARHERWIPLEGMLNLDDFERLAQATLSRAAWGYYACAGDDGYSTFPARALALSPSGEPPSLHPPRARRRRRRQP